MDNELQYKRKEEKIQAKHTSLQLEIIKNIYIHKAAIEEHDEKIKIMHNHRFVYHTNKIKEIHIEI